MAERVEPAPDHRGTEQTKVHVLIEPSDALARFELPTLDAAVSELLASALEEAS